MARPEPACERRLNASGTEIDVGWPAVYRRRRLKAHAAGRTR